MKKILIALMFLTLTACGPGKTGGGSSTPNQPTPPPVQNESILNKFEAVVNGGTGPTGTPAFTGLHNITSLDYSAITLGVIQPDTFCNGDLGNSGTVGPEMVPERSSLLEGTSDEGILQFGHLGYRNIADPTLAEVCREITKERYTYKMTGDILKLCMVNYPYCATYKVVQ